MYRKHASEVWRQVTKSLKEPEPRWQSSQEGNEAGAKGGSLGLKGEGRAETIGTERSLVQLRSQLKRKEGLGPEKPWIRQWWDWLQGMEFESTHLLRRVMEHPEGPRVEEVRTQAGTSSAFM